MLYTGFIIFANEKNNLPVFYTTIPVRGDTNLGRAGVPTRHFSSPPFPWFVAPETEQSLG